ncbi:MAG: flagella basal body P-ring formation protein FlgA [Bryobacteraceae bacterium]
MRLAIILGFVGALEACTLVEGDRILGRHLAEEHASFAGVDANADLGPAPVAGARRSFRYFEVERIARENAVTLPPDTPREACFERATVHLEGETLRSMLRAELLAPDLEVLDYSRNALPAGKPEFRVDGLSPKGMWRGRWLYGENRSVPIWARVKSTATGAGLRAPSLHHEIGRGDTVRVEIRSGGVLLAFDATTESSGHTGEQVTVRNPVNGQRFRAVVEGPGKVGARK